MKTSINTFITQYERQIKYLGMGLIVFVIFMFNVGALQASLESMSRLISHTSDFWQIVQFDSTAKLCYTFFLSFYIFSYPFIFTICTTLTLYCLLNHRNKWFGVFLFPTFFSMTTILIALTAREFI